MNRITRTAGFTASRRQGMLPTANSLIAVHHSLPQPCTPRNPLAIACRLPSHGGSHPEMVFSGRSSDLRSSACSSAAVLKALQIFLKALQTFLLASRRCTGPAAGHHGSRGLCQACWLWPPTTLLLLSVAHHLPCAVPGPRDENEVVLARWGGGER